MRIRHFFALLFIASAIFLSPRDLRAQQTTPEVIKDANEKFDHGDYPAAMPLYSQLLANDRNNANYNYRYGVCVLFASSEKDKALEFLIKASKSKDVDADVWFYLGKAYHLNYQFEQAIVAYNKFKTLGGAKKAEKFQIDNQIAMCKTGRKLLKAITDITVLEKAELNEADFFRHYDLRGSGYSGQLLVKPDDFKTALDKKKGEQSIIFLSGEKNELYFASYGEDETQGKDIYVVRKLPNGDWGKPQNVGYPINTEFDEDYPFMHPNGKVLYFSSKGHNSMGGYDIFRAEMNEETGTWQKPVNLDFAINSPDDDIMFVSDLDEKTAWFASNRNSPSGKMTVYHVVIERKPVSMCLIAGTFTPTDGDPNRAAKITVKTADTNEPIGVYNSNATTGSYLINLPNNGGKYTFTVDHSGIATQSEDVFVPPQYQIKTLNQEIGYQDVSNETKLFIRTDFDADTSMLDPSFLKDKAKLDINGSSDTQTQIVDIGHQAGTLPEAGGNDSSSGNENDTSASKDPADNVPSSSNAKVTNDELIKSANEDATATQSEATDLDNQKDRAYNYANQLNAQAKDKTAEAKKAKEDADAMPDGPDKVAAEQKAADLQTQANALQTQTVAATTVAQGLENDAKNKQAEADKAKQFASSLDKAVKSNDSKAIDAALAQQSELQAMSDTRSEAASTAKNIQDDANKKRADLEKAKTAEQDLKDEISQNQQRIDQLNAEKAKEKDPELRKGIDSQIEGINDDIADDQKQLAVQHKKVEVLQNQSNELDNQAKATNDVLAQSKNPSVSSDAISPDAKKSLSTDVIAYQNSVSDANTFKTYPAVSGTQTPDTQTGTQSTGTQIADTQTGTQTSGTQTGTQTTDTQTGTQSTGTQTTGTQTTDTQTGTQTTGTQTGNDPGDVATQNENPDAEFTDALQKTDSITDPVAREKAKAQVYTDWSASIDDQIKEKKQEIAGTTDKTKKSELNADLKKLQAESSQKKQDYKNSVAAADKARKQNDSQGGTQPAVSTDQQFVKQIDAADQEQNVVAKENRKAQIYSDWSDSLKAEADRMEKSATKLSAQEKKKVQEQVIAKRADADSLSNLADAAKTKATEAETASQATTTQPTSTDVQYTDPQATQALTEQKTLTAQADQDRAKKDSLSNLAASATGDQKTQLLQQATDAQREAWNKDAQAASKLGDADKIQFEKNNNQLKGFDAAAVNSSNTSAGTASLLSDEARNLFEKARQERDSAAATSNNYIRNEALQNAADNEKKAIQKQQEALALYQRSGIEPVATTGTQTGTQTTGTQTGTQTTGTQTGTQTTGTQSGTQTTDTQTGTQTTGTQTGTQTTGTQTADTQTGTQTTGTQTATHTADTQTGTQTTSTQIVDPSTGEPLTSIQINQIRTSDAYKNYSAADLEAIQSENESAGLKIKADQYQASADSNVAKAQNLSLQAADEKDSKKKKELINQSTQFNEAAKKDMGSRDSLNELADVASMNANASRNKANSSLTGTDQPTADKIKAIAKADQENSGTVARTGTHTTDTQTGTHTTDTQTGTQTADTQTGTHTTDTQTGTQTADTQTGAHTTDTQTGTHTTDTQSGTHTTDTQTGTHTTDTQTGTQTTDAQTGGTNSSSVANRLAPGEQFKIAPKNTAQPVASIKLNPELPTGLVYKVQIGAFRNPISPEIYKGISPVTAETTASGLTRYTAGLFTQFSNADAAKNEIRGMGYRDAFVVAFYNGKRISVDEARRMSGESSTQSTVAQTGTQNTGTQTTDTQTGTQNTGTQSNDSQTGTQTYQNSTTQQDVKEVKGLFFTVQIGVYKNPVTNSRLKNLPEIVNEKTPNGFIRYSSGKYCSQDAAVVAKNNAVAKGVSDAFVTAYYNGKRITPAEAQALIATGVEPCSGGQKQTPVNSQQTSSQITQPENHTSQPESKQPETQNTQPETHTTQPETQNTQPATKQPETQNTQTESKQPETQNPEPVTQLSTKPPVPETGLVFSVQIGAFKDEVPVEIANQFLQLASKGVKNYFDPSSGLTVYQVGVCLTKDEAETLRTEAVSKGITDAFIVAFSDGKKITMEEALKLSGQ
jgi:hypothetical protein